jgi:hypothetical protein
VGIEEDRALEQEIATFDRMKGDLEAHHMGKWVLIRGEELINTFDTLDVAATEAVRLFGRGPYLIRQVGAPYKVTLPASVMYHPVHAQG